jgi:putative ABC transport system permease protein
LALRAIARRIDSDQRLNLKAQAEPEYYAEQTKTAGPIKVLGGFMAILMAIGASFAVMNTMYAAVARRSREIGVLRVLGFQPASILLSFLGESVLLAVLGGLVGCLLALPIHGLTTGTMNFRTFSDISFAFRITPDLLLNGLGFSWRWVRWAVSCRPGWRRGNRWSRPCGKGDGEPRAASRGWRAEHGESQERPVADS